MVMHNLTPLSNSREQSPATTKEAERSRKEHRRQGERGTKRVASNLNIDGTIFVEDYNLLVITQKRQRQIRNLGDENTTRYSRIQGRDDPYPKLDQFAGCSATDASLFLLPAGTFVLMKLPSKHVIALILV